MEIWQNLEIQHVQWHMIITETQIMDKNVKIFLIKLFGTFVVLILIIILGTELKSSKVLNELSYYDSMYLQSLAKENESYKEAESPIQCITNASTGLGASPTQNCTSTKPHSSEYTTAAINPPIIPPTTGTYA